MLVAGETLNIFLLTGILNINIFFIKKKNIEAVNSKIYDLFASKIQPYNVKEKRKKTLHKQIYQKPTQQISIWEGKGCLPSSWSWPEPSCSSPPPPHTFR